MKIYILHYQRTERFGLDGTREIFRKHTNKWELHLDYHKLRENPRNHSFKVEELCIATTNKH
jgi:hypothetical protein